ncbi:MAG: carbamoyltransferase HypF [Calditrichaeota bacterium]|nr:MAG: carbamoyltransferase HypF [Calditrichota bacterium]
MSESLPDSGRILQDKDVAVSLHAAHIHIRGKVQGVGFRPFVYRLAKQLGLTGWVNNTVDGVHIEVEGERETVEAFYRRVLSEHPPIALITGSDIREVPLQHYKDFTVQESSARGETEVLILPDLDVCPDCVAELNDPLNRRYRYPFITCTNCGPRYSIITRLPYDRPHTTMAEYEMCPECAAEYRDPGDRRFYSQTNSCSICGIRYALLDNSRRILARQEPALLRTVELIREGKILAVKGLGGYLLMVNAFNEAAVATLRRRKHRPAKPFALMFPDVATVRRYTRLSSTEEEHLCSREKPILILQRRRFADGIAPSVAPGQDTLGIMLPYTPLHYLLMKELNQPVVATSGNISGSPILATEEQAFRLLGDVADAFLINDREIAMPQDDSVIRITPEFDQLIMLRRSRSFAPLFPPHILSLQGTPAILAMGAHLKSTVTLSHATNVYVSQYLGELDDYETEQNFHRVMGHLQRLLSFTPEIIAVDSHPQYTATRIGEALAREHNIPLVKVQHHQAHFWALLAEHGLLGTDEPVLGVIWDGTGWGEDRAIWGSEFFLYRRGEMERVGHLEYYPLLAGDKAAREPRLSALGLWHSQKGAEDLLKSRFSPTEWNIYRRLLERRNFFPTSSMGRLFDGVASLLGLMDYNSFEGEAAMQVERLAWHYYQSEKGRAIKPGNMGYSLHYDPAQKEIRLSGLLKGVLGDIQKGVPREQIAFRFHLALVRMIQSVVHSTGVTGVGFSGGVFQNALLVDLLYHLLSDTCTLYFHRWLPPNDENISFGQMVMVAYQKGVCHV